MANTNAAEAYRRQQILTATPETLTLMLYNGCLKFIKDGREALEAKKWEEANNLLQRAQRIIVEFRLTLDMQYEISHQLQPLYEYAYNCLVEGNLRTDFDKIDEATTIMTELRDAWVGAMKKAQEEKGLGKGGNGYA